MVQGFPCVNVSCGTIIPRYKTLTMSTVDDRTGPDELLISPQDIQTGSVVVQVNLAFVIQGGISVPLEVSRLIGSVPYVAYLNHSRSTLLLVLDEDSRALPRVTGGIYHDLETLIIYKSSTDRRSPELLIIPGRAFDDLNTIDLTLHITHALNP